MTLEEAIQAANNGDATAALAVADYYYGDGKDPDKEEAALPWYEKAGNGGNLKGAVVAMLIHSSDAEAYMMMNSYDNALNSWQAVSRWAIAAMDHSDANLKTKMLSVEKYNYAVFQMGVCLNEQGNPTAAISILRHADTTDVKSQLLLGICLVKEKQDDSAFPLLTLVKTASSYRETVGRASMDEQLTFANASIVLSRFYRDGSVVGQKDYDEAVNILLMAKQIFAANSNITSALQKELSHYQKKLFGGYNYVG